MSVIFWHLCKNTGHRHKNQSDGLGPFFSIPKFFEMVSWRKVSFRNFKHFTNVFLKCPQLCHPSLLWYTVLRMGSKDGWLPNVPTALAPSGGSCKWRFGLASRGKSGCTYTAGILGSAGLGSWWSPNQGYTGPLAQPQPLHPHWCHCLQYMGQSCNLVCNAWLVSSLFRLCSHELHPDFWLTRSLHQDGEDAYAVCMPNSKWTGNK